MAQTDWITQVRDKPAADAREFQFEVTPNVTILAGARTVTIPVQVPYGINGADDHHYIYLSGGTGVAEAVKITGGTAVSGSTTLRTITFTCANDHSGAWTITSASGGIFEANIYLSGQGTILIPKGIYQIYAMLMLPTGISLKGAGGKCDDAAAATFLNCAAAANPALVITDGLGFASYQGYGKHSDYNIVGTGNTHDGIWIGGDPTNVFAPSTYTGSKVSFENVVSAKFRYALVHYRGNFVDYSHCEFNGLTLALYVPSTGGGESQPVSFWACLFTVPLGVLYSIQIDASGFKTNPFEIHAGQITGTVKGNDMVLNTYGVHWEPPNADLPLVELTGNCHVRVFGGLLAGIGTNVPSLFSIVSGAHFLLVEGAQYSMSGGGTLQTIVDFATGTDGVLVFKSNIDLGAGTVARKVTLAAGVLPQMNLEFSANSLNVTVPTGGGGGANKITFPEMNYPVSQHVALNGVTLAGNITSVEGLYAGQIVNFHTQEAQTFTAGATIGNTITTVAFQPYVGWFDGTKLWIK